MKPKARKPSKRSNHELLVRETVKTLRKELGTGHNYRYLALLANNFLGDIVEGGFVPLNVLTGRKKSTWKFYYERNKKRKKEAEARKLADAKKGAVK